MNNEKEDNLVGPDPEATWSNQRKDDPFKWCRKKYRGHNDYLLDPLRRAAVPFEPGPDALSRKEKEERRILVHRLQTLVANKGNRGIDDDLVRAAIGSARELKFPEERIADLLGLDREAYGNFIDRLWPSES